MQRLLVPLCALLLAPSIAFAANEVTVTEDAGAYTLSNGIVTAKVAKRSGDLVSLVYNEMELLNPEGRHPGAYWSHSAASDQMTQAITIDPKTNDGAIGEVSVKGTSNGHRMGSGPGGSVIADIEIRYALLRGESGVYTYTILTHRPQYPATSLGEARFCAKLNDAVFDWMTVDANRSKRMFTARDWNYGEVMNMKEVRRFTTGIYKGEIEHKYDYSANQFDVLAWGWSSTTRHVGIWFVNPTIEYLSGGPTKMELSAHRDATFNPQDKTAPAPPCLLNYWRGSHYGGSSCVAAEGEQWTKVVGPFLIYCNRGESPQAMWKDALARSSKETAAWPYDWVSGVDYPHKSERGTVTGRLVLDDPQADSRELKHLLVGVTHPDYDAPGFRGGTQRVDWQLDAKHYQFWARAGADGRFTIPNVSPGAYTLHAIADNVLGEFAKTDITVAPGETVDLRTLPWKPQRFGRQVWEIGVPDRKAGEFRHGDRYWQWGLYNLYPKDFPNDVNYVVGKSDWRTDWNIMQVPRARDDTGKGRGDATMWTITFDLPSAASKDAKATLRLAFASWETRELAVAVNDTPVATISGVLNNGAIHRDCDRGYWSQRDVTFDASLLKSGANTIRLAIPEGPVTAGIEYDYLRLEVDDSSSRASKE
jgi:rhamnogalacturonan endolyase